jgi:predicted AlkP superfamily pyrophosphatase or phosphodiesterase
MLKMKSLFLLKKSMRFTLLLSIILFQNSFAQEKTTPKLIVGIVVDQMCYEYLYRYQSRYSQGGFNRLMFEGTNCRSAMYNYVPTYTGPGHASIYTGTTPENHGIVGNDWYERSSKKSVNCIEDLTVKAVGATTEEGKCSPNRLLVNTITDQLKMTYPNAKVISMSIKNRGAILPGGHLSDGSYWFDYTTGDFITSTFYKQTLPSWVTNFNKQDYPQSYLKQTWKTLYDIKTYTASGKDDSPYEHLLPGKTTPTFPYDLSVMSKDTLNFDLFTTTPFADSYLTNFAIGALKNESLGKDEQTDFLAISYSTPDIIGHEFGTQAVEIEDTYLRLDQDIERLLNALDDEVGSGEYIVFLTADHAVVPVPQYLVDNKLPGGYVFLSEPLKNLQTKITEKFGANYFKAHTNLNIYLNDSLIQANKANRQEIAEFAKAEIMHWEGVKRAYTGQELLASGYGDFWTEKIKRGYNKNVSGDVVFMLESGYLPKQTPNSLTGKGTSHGSAYSYDSHVPLLWFGAQIPKKEVFRVVEITDIVPTLAHFMNVAFPSSVTGKPILELLEE